MVVRLSQPAASMEKKNNEYSENGEQGVWGRKYKEVEQRKRQKILITVPETGRRSWIVVQAESDLKTNRSRSFNDMTHKQKLSTTYECVLSAHSDLYWANKSARLRF